MRVEESTLEVSWPAELEKNEELFAGLQTANRALEKQLGRSKKMVTAEWKAVPGGPNHTLLELTLIDRFTKSQVVKRLTLDEIRNEDYLWKCLHRLWGDLLWARSERQLRMLEELAAQAGEE